MHKLIFLALLSSPILIFSQADKSWDHEKIQVYNDNSLTTLMHAESIFEDRWDILPQPQFWKQIMRLSPDSCLINIAESRTILLKMSIRDWSRQTEAQKTVFKDKIGDSIPHSFSEFIPNIFSASFDSSTNRMKCVTILLLFTFA